MVASTVIAGILGLLVLTTGAILMFARKAHILASPIHQETKKIQDQTHLMTENLQRIAEDQVKYEQRLQNLGLIVLDTPPSSAEEGQESLALQKPLRRIS